MDYTTQSRLDRARRWQMRGWSGAWNHDTMPATLKNTLDLFWRAMWCWTLGHSIDSYAARGMEFASCGRCWQEWQREDPWFAALDELTRMSEDLGLYDAPPTAPAPGPGGA